MDKIGCFIDGLIDWLIDWVIGWLIDWLIVWSIDWLIVWLIDWLIHSLFDWLIDCLFYWSIYCVIDLLATWLVESFLFSPNHSTLPNVLSYQYWSDLCGNIKSLRNLWKWSPKALPIHWFGQGLGLGQRARRKQYQISLWWCAFSASPHEPSLPPPPPLYLLPPNQSAPPSPSCVILNPSRPTSHPLHLPLE